MKGIIEPYINFKGNTRQAFEFYADVFETDPPDFMTFNDLPDADKEASRPFVQDMDMIMNSSINIHGNYLMASDTTDEMNADVGGFIEGNNISLSWSGENKEDVKKVWDKFVAAGSVVYMPLAQTFWAELYGILKDPYGIVWMIQNWVREDAEPKPE